MHSWAHDLHEPGIGTFDMPVNLFESCLVRMLVREPLETDVLPSMTVRASLAQDGGRLTAHRIGNALESVRA
jgi:hypothetical protein